MGPVSVLIDALKAQDSTKVYKWEYIAGQYGGFTQSGDNRTYAAVGINPVCYSGGGLQSWGQTCGVAIAAATIAQMVNKRAQIDQMFAVYGQIPHPMPEIGNSEWLKNGVAANLPAPLVAVPPTKLGSLQCHNALFKFEKAVAGITGYTRSDGCARLCADLAYQTMQILNKEFNGTAWTTVPLSTTKATCAVSGCHPTTTGKEDCYVCHK
jgi:hypothetical protein